MTELAQDLKVILDEFRVDYVAATSEDKEEFHSIIPQIVEWYEDLTYTKEIKMEPEIPATPYSEQEAEKYLDKETTVSYQDQEHFNSVIEADMARLELPDLGKPEIFELSEGFEHRKEEDKIMHDQEKLLTEFATYIVLSGSFSTASVLVLKQQAKDYLSNDGGDNC
jgi:hypothetical protein